MREREKEREIHKRVIVDRHTRDGSLEAGM